MNIEFSSYCVSNNIISTLLTFKRIIKIFTLKKTLYFKVQKFSPNYFREKNVILLAYKKPSMYQHKIKVIVAGTQAESTSNAKYHQKWLKY